jgi:hypothetical protein
MAMASVLIDGLIEAIRKHVPGFQLKFKDESRFMKLLGVLTYPFNQHFMEGFITTIGTTVYFPSRKSIEEHREEGAAATMSHEFVHMWDSERQWLRYNLGYLSPQIFFIPLLAVYAVLGSWIPVVSVLGGISVAYLALWAVIKMTNDKGKPNSVKERNRKIRLGVFFTLFVVAVGGYAALAIIFSGWWAALAVGAFIPLAPWPSPWRSKWEFRGYGMSVCWQIWRHGDITPRRLDNMSSRFTGMDYFRMDPNKERVQKRLNDYWIEAKSGAVLDRDKSEPYRAMHDYLSLGELLHANQ